MSQPFIYIVGRDKMYLTNKTNVSALWEVVERELGDEKDLQISYHENEGDTCYTVMPARKQKIKVLCQEVVRNRILIHKEGDMTGTIISIHQDLYRGRD
jgi:hypothetical protein